MWGTTGACSRSTTPGLSSQPSVSTPCSTPRENRICMPTQMPSTGRPPASRRPMTSWPRTARSPCMQAAKAPTPGTTRPSASCAVARSAVRVTDAPARSRTVTSFIGSEGALGGGHAGLAGVDRDRVAERPGERLELRLDQVVRVAPGQHPDVQGEVRVEGEGLEDVPGQGSLVVAADDDVRLGLGLAGVHAVRPPGHVHDGLHQCLVEGHGGVAEAADADLVAERLAERLAEHDRGVLDGVVGVDVGVALGADHQVDQRVPGEGGEHVVVEPDTGAHLGAAGAVEVDLDVDGRLLGLPVQLRYAAHPASSMTSVSACLNACISSAVPIDTRSHPSGPVSRISTPRSSSPCQTACRSAKRPNNTKFASLSATSSPCSRNQPTVSSRSARRSSTRPSSSGACRSAASAVAWVTAERWYGSRTTRIASQISGAAARYPSRAPARANALLIVRDTTRLRSDGSSSSALGVPARRNSAYASSTTTR